MAENRTKVKGLPVSSGGVYTKGIMIMRLREMGPAAPEQSAEFYDEIGEVNISTKLTPAPGMRGQEFELFIGSPEVEKASDQGRTLRHLIRFGRGHDAEAIHKRAVALAQKRANVETIIKTIEREFSLGMRRAA